MTFLRARWLKLVQALRPGARAGRGEDIALCRAIEQHGWEHVHRADTRERGTVLLIASGNRGLALRAAELWLAPADVAKVDHLAPDDPTREALVDALTATLGEGKRVVVTARTTRLATALTAELARDIGCSVIPVVARAAGKASTLTLGAPITAAPDEGHAALEVRLRSHFDSSP